VHDPHMSVLAGIYRLLEEAHVTRLSGWSPIVCIAASATICTDHLEVVERLYSSDHHCPQAPARTGWRSDSEYFCNISRDHGSFRSMSSQHASSYDHLASERRSASTGLWNVNTHRA
jgi:hypothetical protein